MKAEPTLNELWEQVKARLKLVLALPMYERWIAPMKASHMEEDAVWVHVSSQMYRFWLEDNYGELLNETVSALADKPMRVAFCQKTDETKLPPNESEVGETASKSEATACSEEVESLESKSGTVLPPMTPGLNANFNFESFVVGPANHYAHAASWAVAHAPGRAYNPLFIYGATGLGKSHLMHAIGHQVAAQKSKARVAYVSTERFVNEFIDAIQNNKFLPFRKKYRQCDILLLDDIHFLGRMERIQEEFFHTFNTLFESQKQIVLSSDRPATEISNLEERLVSRFEWGLTVQLQPPDQETRQAILRRKQLKSQVPISEDVLDFLAIHIKSNVRRLEGAWAKIWFASKLKGRVLTLEEAQEQVQDVLLEEGRTAMNAETIQKRVSLHFDVRHSDMMSKRRSAEVAFARQVAMYLCRSMTPMSLQQIGDAFGGRDHGTVMHACRLVEKRVQEDPTFKQTVTQLTRQLTN